MNDGAVWRCVMSRNVGTKIINNWHPRRNEAVEMCRTMTYHAVAEAVGVSTATVSRWWQERDVADALRRGDLDV